MEWMDGENELTLTCRHRAGGVAVLRCETRDPVIHLPDTILGVPVTALGDYAMARRAPDLSGIRDLFTVHVGRGQPEPHDADGIRQVTLPLHLQSLGDYAFYDCQALEQLDISPAMADVGSGAFLNCSHLHNVQLAVSPSGESCLRGVLREHHGELLCRMHFADGTQARLWFPAYSEEYEELAAPHIFGYHIEGAGFTYRQCFDGKKLNFSQYDAALERLVRTRDFEDAVRVALGRLRWPKELSPANREQYRALVAEHAAAALKVLADARDTEDMAWALGLELFPPKALQAACDRARNDRDTEMLGLLMEHLHRTGAGRTKTFDL